jgi:hypothetical protein
LYPEYEIHFCVDHSCGHDRQREDGLDATKMNKVFGGKQRWMRSSAIKEHDGFLGSFPASLKVGDTQHFRFQPSDDGPFWISSCVLELYTDGCDY